ncbi:hypothetical protein AALO_G00086600 [Alosa alosa]|uniref:NIDO domain-containing protein n=1 Tax=Alosa alosa TaxID=278164 RepID=A0AAV6GYV1_9TELE|nr:sushi, nidogen and EGF-like domain-containing protein 1 [Alosa alosa]KAG5280234.1 hypothetical protein AALO_G00086600 [Alosa alosa]
MQPYYYFVTYCTDVGDIDFNRLAPHPPLVPTPQPITGTTASFPAGVFYPFGPGDSYTHRYDDDNTYVPLPQPFRYFRQTFSWLYVSNNGFLAFDYGWYSWSPHQFPAYAQHYNNIIAPFWTDIDNTRRGNISYQQYTNGSVLQQATTDINQYFPGLSFSASWVFVATWDKVEYYEKSGTETSFQVVLISGGNRSFTLMNYGAIASTRHLVQVSRPHMQKSHK